MTGPGVAGPWLLDEVECSWVRYFRTRCEAARVEFNADGYLTATVWTPGGVRRTYHTDTAEARRTADTNLRTFGVAFDGEAPRDDRGRL